MGRPHDILEGRRLNTYRREGAGPPALHLIWRMKKTATFWWRLLTGGALPLMGSVPPGEEVREVFPQLNGGKRDISAGGLCRNFRVPESM